MNKNNILIVIGEFRTIGGAEKQAIILAEALKLKGYNVTILGQIYGDTIGDILKSKKISYEIFGFWREKSLLQTIKKYIKLIFVIRKIKPHYIIPFISYNSKVIGLIWKFTQAKYAIWNQRDEGRSLTGSKIEKFAANNLSTIVSNSIEGKIALEKKLNIKKKIHVINNGIIIPENIKNFYWKKKLKLENTSIVSMIANLTKYKDHITLLKAWNIINIHFQGKKRVTLILAGDFKEKTLELKALCYDLKLNNVFFIGKTDRTNELINDSDLIVHSSYTEGCPNAILESMAMGKAVVATDILGTHQALGEKYADYCFTKKKDYKNLAERIILLLENNKLRRDIGNYNLNRIKSDFNIENLADNYLNLIK